MKKYSPKILLHRTYFQRLKAVIWKSSSTAILAMNISKVLAIACPIIFSKRESGTKKTTVFFNTKVVLQGICEILPPRPIILIFSLINKLLITFVMFTNQNAVAKGVRNWKPVSRKEIKAFIAMLIISNQIVVVPRDEHFSLTPPRTKMFHVPGVRNILSSRDRFFELKKCIYFCDPEHELTEEEKKDPLYKVRHFYNTVV